MIPARIPLTVTIGLALTIILDTGVQVFWKTSLSGIHQDAGLLDIAAGLFAHPEFYLVLVMFIFQFVIWIKVIEKSDLSFAQPITALSMVSVCMLSACFLGENITAIRVLGIGLILAGVWFISQTDHNTIAVTLPANRHEDPACCAGASSKLEET